MNIDISTQNGSTFYTLKTNHKGFIEGVYMIAAGQTYLKHAHRHLPAAFASMVCRSTQTSTEEVVNERLEGKGIQLSTTVNCDYLIYSFTCRSEDLEELVEILAEQIQQPALKVDEWEALRSRMLASLQMQADNTDQVANIVFSRDIFTEESLNYQDTPEESIKTLKAMSVEQIRAYHASFNPAEGIWVAAGDVDQEQLKSAVQKHLKSTVKHTLSKQYSPKATKSRSSKVKHTEMPAKQSVSLRMGQVIDIDIHHPDYMPLKLALDALGGSFSARLMRTVRDEDGLTYSVGSMLRGFAQGEVGSWFIYGAFSPKLLDKGIQSIQKQLKLWKKSGISQAELDERKQGLIGRYLVAQSAPSKIVSDLAGFIANGFGSDELIAYPKRIEAVSLQQVNSVIDRYIDLDKITIHTAGTKD